MRNIEIFSSVSWGDEPRPSFRVASFQNPQLVSPTTARVRIVVATTIRRRTASSTESRAIVRMGCLRSIRGLPQQVEEPLLQRFATRLDGVEAGPGADEGVDQSGNRLLLNSAHEVV